MGRAWSLWAGGGQAEGLSMGCPWAERGPKGDPHIHAQNLHGGSVRASGHEHVRTPSAAYGAPALRSPGASRGIGTGPARMAQGAGADGTVITPTHAIRTREKW